MLPFGVGCSTSHHRPTPPSVRPIIYVILCLSVAVKTHETIPYRLRYFIWRSVPTALCLISWCDGIRNPSPQHFSYPLPTTQSATCHIFECVLSVYETEFSGEEVQETRTALEPRDRIQLGTSSCVTLTYTRISKSCLVPKMFRICIHCERNSDE
jgi:hypothetical protein